MDVSGTLERDDIINFKKDVSKNNKLPYFQINGTNETKKIVISLLWKLEKKIRKKNSFHYLIFTKKHQYLNFIKKNNKEYKYFETVH